MANYHLNANAQKGPGLGAALDYGQQICAESEMKAQAYQAKCAQTKPATELAADLHNLLDAQEGSLRMLGLLSDKLFGPSPEMDVCDKPCYPDYLTATVGRARRQAEELANQIQRINANI